VSKSVPKSRTAAASALLLGKTSIPEQLKTAYYQNFGWLDCIVNPFCQVEYVSSDSEVGMPCGRPVASEV
jgi:hypothetical protein